MLSATSNIEIEVFIQFLFATSLYLGIKDDRYKTSLRQIDENTRTPSISPDANECAKFKNAEGPKK